MMGFLREHHSVVRNQIQETHSDLKEQLLTLAMAKKVIKETGYTKSLLWVRQDNFFVIRAINWVKDGGYLKYMDFRKLEVVDGIWVGTHVVVTTKKGKKTVHKTILNWNNVKFNQKLDYGMFTVRRMEKGL